MGSERHGRWRVPRAGAFGAAAVALGAVSHLAGGGSAPSLAVLAALTFPVALISLVLTSAPRRRGTLPLTLGAVQVLLHHGFMLLGPTAAPDCPAVAATPAGDVHALHVAADPLSCNVSALAAAPEHDTGWLMVLAHLAATAITSWALARGDAWLAGLLVGLLARVRRLPSAVRTVVLPRAGRRPAVAVLGLRQLVVVGGGVGRRGPPSAWPPR